MNRTFSSIAVATAALALALGNAGAAHASQPADATSKKDKSTEACWEAIDTGRSACAESPEALAQLLLEEYNVVIAAQDGFDDVPAELTIDETAVGAKARSGASIQATYILGEWFKDANYSGSRKLLTADLSSTPCTFYGSYTYGQYDVLSFEWDNAISSVRGYGQCGMKLYNGTYASGSLYGPVFQSGNLGVFNDVTSSVYVVRYP